MGKYETKTKEKGKLSFAKPVYGLSLAMFFFLASAERAAAVPPPDFIFSIGSSVVQIFSFLVIVFSVAVGFMKRFFESSLLFVRHRRAVWVGVAMVIILLAYFGAVALSQ